MAIKFILGKAGSGKTSHILEQIVEDINRDPGGYPIILLVPEQATLEKEKRLLNEYNLSSLFRCQILSFRRLAHLVLKENGGLGKVDISEVGKRMLLRKYLQENKNKLKMFGPSVSQTGFIEKMEKTIDDFRKYKIDREFLSGALTYEKGHLIHNKLEDIFLIKEEYENYLMDNFLEELTYLEKMNNLIENSSFIGESQIYIDGFNGFTPLEISIIENLIKKAKGVTFSFTTRYPELMEHFKKFDEMKDSFKEIAMISGKKILPDLNLNLDEKKYGDSITRFQNESLKKIEKELFYLKNEEAELVEESVQVYSAQNPKTEIDFVARKIREFIIEKGYKYRDIGVYIRNNEYYENLVENTFKNYDIPFFMDRKVCIGNHPLILMIESMINIFMNDWKTDDLFNYLKNDLVEINSDSVDIFENYVFKYGIGREHFKNHEKFVEHLDRTSLDDEQKQRVLSAYELIITPLLNLALSFKGERDGIEYLKAIYEFLEKNNISKTLESWCVELEAEKEFDKALKHSQVYDSVISSFEEYGELLRNEKMGLSEFREILLEGLSNIKVGLIPASFDQVLVGSIERTVSPNFKIVFVLEMNEGVYPSRVESSGLISDYEKELFLSKGIKIGLSVEDRINNENMYIYLAMTRASEYLILTYPINDAEGKVARASRFVKKVSSMFADFGEEYIAIEPEEYDEKREVNFVNHEELTLGYLGVKLRQGRLGYGLSDLWKEVYNYYLRLDKGNFKKIIEGLFYSNEIENLSEEAVKKLYGERFPISVSRIENFNSCPFKHFADYGLKLKEREIFKMRAPDLGNFYHDSLELFFRKLNEEGLELEKLHKPDISDLLEKTADDVLEKKENSIFSSSAKYKFWIKKYKKALLNSVMILREHDAKGSYRPISLEYSFGDKSHMFNFKLKNGIEVGLRGRIDRIDLARLEDNIYIRIIDYKSGMESLDLALVYHGLKLQLLTYIEAAINEIKDYFDEYDDEEILPGGIFYFQIKDAYLSKAGPSKLEANSLELMKDYKLNGLALADVKNVELMDKDSKNSPLLPVSITKKGEKEYEKTHNVKDLFSSNSKVVDKDEFEMLRKYVINVIRDSSENISQGIIKVRPYQYNNEVSACLYCPYRSLCMFDLELEGNNYRNLKKIDSEDIIKNIKGSGDENVD